MPETCPNCGKQHWGGNQVILMSGIRMFEAGVWIRNTQCRFCEKGFEQIRYGKPIPLESRDQEVDPRGLNPFMDGT